MTRQRRVEVSVSKMDRGKRRPCCFDLSSCTDPDLASSGKLREPSSAARPPAEAGSATGDLSASNAGWPTHPPAAGRVSAHAGVRAESGKVVYDVRERLLLNVGAVTVGAGVCGLERAT